jgi:hypothetical protein
MPRAVQRIKAVDTSVSVNRSQGQLEKILRRYGASGFSITQDYEAGTAAVAFRVPESPGADVYIPVRMAVPIHQVKARLKANAGPRTRRREADWFEQAERIAWRHLVLCVEAMLVAVETGIQTISEAFLAHMLIEDETGEQARVYDMFERQGGARALLMGRNS